MKQLLLGMVIGLAIVNSGCSGGMNSAGSNEDSASASVSGFMYSIQAATTDNQSVAAGVPAGVGNASTLTDDQLVDALIARLTDALAKVKKSMAEAEARGAVFPQELKDGVARLEEGTAKTIERLKTDAAFRARIVAGLRRLGNQPALPVPQPPKPVEQRLCDQFAKDIAAGKWNAADTIKAQAQYDKDCKKKDE